MLTVPSAGMNAELLEHVHSDAGDAEWYSHSGIDCLCPIKLTRSHKSC